MQNPRALTWTLVVLLAWSASTWAQPPKPPKPPEGVKALRDLDYVAKGHERQKLDLYLPEKTVGPLPVVVWVHGGGWRQGSKNYCPALYLSAKGYAVASVNYRLSEHAVFPAQIEDCKAAIRWLRANAKKYDLNPERIGAWGSSAGGHLVALLGTTGNMKQLEGALGNLDQSSKVQCVVDWFGPTDFRDLGKGDDDPKGAVALLLGGQPSKEMEKARLASPLLHVGKDCAPFLIMHGDKDPLVKFSQSEALDEALKKVGVPATLVKLEGAAHGGKEFHTDENRQRIEAFFDKWLKGAK